jgi:hypothetical protein
MHQSSQKGKWNDAPMAALTNLMSQHLLRTGQNIGQAPWAFHRMDKCALKKKCSINQINQVEKCWRARYFYD